MWACAQSSDTPSHGRRSWRSALSAQLLFLLLLGGCDESLPPRNDPVQVLDVSMGGLVHEVVFDSLGVSRGQVPFRIRVNNVYDEVLQWEALIQGTLEIRFQTPQPLRAEITIDAGDLENRWVLANGLLTVGVDSGAVLSPRWSHEIPSGTPVWRYLTMHRMMSPKGDIYYQSDSVETLVEGSIQVFKNVQPLKIAPIRWTFIYTVVGPTADFSLP